MRYIDALVLATLAACAPAASAPQPTTEPHHELHLPPVGPSVHVTMDGNARDIALASLPHVGTSALVVDLWKAAFPGEDPLPLHFDLVGSDGFHPGSRPKCARLLTGSEILGAHVDVVSHDISFDDALGLPGCYRVKAVVSMDGAR
jgi:hypothetical protein